jgi:hypothetical protein
MYSLFYLVHFVGLIFMLFFVSVVAVLDTLHLDGLISFNVSNYREEIEYFGIFLVCAPTLTFIFLIAKTYYEIKKK